MQFAPVDVDERCALAEDFDAVLGLLHTWQILEHGLSCAHLAQQRVLDISLEALSCDFEGWPFALDDDLAQLSCFWLQRDGTQVGLRSVQDSRLVA